MTLLYLCRWVNGRRTYVYAVEEHAQSHDHSRQCRYENPSLRDISASSSVGRGSHHTATSDGEFSCGEVIDRGRRAGWVGGGEGRLGTVKWRSSQDDELTATECAER